MKATASSRTHRQKPETTALLLLLVIHDYNFHHLSVAPEERPQIAFGDIGGQAAEKNFRISSIRAFRLVQRAGITWSER